MAISVPDEPVYYYECHAGDFRLVAFLPTAHLERLAAEGQIAHRALVDFPDGLDLDCTEPDFRQFEETYDYRHPHDAGKLRQAFLAIFSSTHDWRKFRGSGYLAAADLEAELEPVERVVRETAEVSEPRIRSRGAAPPEDRRQATRERATQRRELRSALERYEAKSVDPAKSLRQQRFRKIKMSKGEPAPEFFAKVQRKGGR